MRRLIGTNGVVAVLMLLASLAGCNRPKAPMKPTVEENPGLSSKVDATDTKTAPQLLRGFYDVEQNAWRWTASKFAVKLRAPRGAAQSGAKLTLHFSLPEPVIAKTGPMTLRAKVGDAELPPETYATPGDHVYTKDVPASALTGENATVEFATDKYLKPGDVETRELATIFQNVALEPK